LDKGNQFLPSSNEISVPDVPVQMAIDRFF